MSGDGCEPFLFRAIWIDKRVFLVCVPLWRENPTGLAAFVIDFLADLD